MWVKASVRVCVGCKIDSFMHLKYFDMGESGLSTVSDEIHNYADWNQQEH